MATKEIVNVKGWVTLSSYYFIDKDKTYLESIETITQNNLVTSAGKNFFAKKIIDDSSIEGISISDIAIGQGDTVAAIGNTSLNDEFFRKPISVKEIQSDGNVTLYKTAIPIGEGVGTVRELGLFASDNTLICRIVLDQPFLKVLDELLTIEWFIQIG